MHRHSITTCRPIGTLLLTLGLTLSATAQREWIGSTQQANTPAATATASAPDTVGNPETTPPARIVPIHTAAHDAGYAYGIWGSGRGYKISFHDGATFVPMLGKDYPHNQPFRWQTTSAQIGAVELATHRPRLSHTDSRACFDHGSIVEAYDLRPTGVEQTFLIAKRIADGDLVIRGQLHTQLEANHTPAQHGDLQFYDQQGQHILSYGAATAVDSAGQRRQMTTAYENGQITLTLSAEWLATATYPVIVDPLIWSGLRVGSNVVAEVDILRASEGAGDMVWIAYGQWASALDRDVHMHRFDDDGTPMGALYADLTATWSSQNVSCAYSAEDDYGVVLFDRWFASGDRWLRFHRHARSNYALNTSVHQIWTPGHAWRGDVGGTSGLGATSTMLAVWQEEPDNGPFQNSSTSKIRACYLDLANGSNSVAFPIADAVNNNQERPSVNQCASGHVGDSWHVAYQTVAVGVIGGTDNWDIAVKRVNQHGQVSAPFFLDVGSNDHKFAPRIEGRNGRYLVAYLATPQGAAFPTADRGHQVRVSRFDGPFASEPHPAVTLQSNNDARLELAGLGFDRATASHWALLFRSNVTDNLYLRTVGYRGQQLQEESVFVSSGSEVVRGGISYNHTNGEFVIGYGVNSSTDYVTMKRFQYPPIPPVTKGGSACSAATIDWLGSQQIGTETSRIGVMGADPSSLHLLIMAMAPASQVLVGLPPIVDGCWLLVPNTGPDYVGIAGVRVGESVRWSLPLPEFLVDDTYYFQDFHTTDSGVFELVSTKRLHVPIGK